MIIIDFQERRKRPPDNLITLRPLEFRRAFWDSSDFVLMRRPDSQRLEKRRAKKPQDGLPGMPGLPPHLVLGESMACTANGLYFHKGNEKSMRDVYYLAGLVDCMINRVSPPLRTGALRYLYHKVSVMKATLNVNWYAPINRVLFPIDDDLYNEMDYIQALAEARRLDQLYLAVRNGVEEMFSILASEYVFYTPGMGDHHGR